MKLNYPVAGQCIYCGSTSDLSDEHIIPYSFGEHATVKSASCILHAEMTSTLEAGVAQYAYGNYRDGEGIQTRRPKKRAAREKQGINLLAINYNDTLTIINDSVSNMPRNVIFSHWPEPEGISGAPLSIGGIATTLEAKVDAERTQLLLTKHGVKTIIFHASYKPDTFARVLAKIAHTYACAMLGVGNFLPTLLPIIFGTSYYQKLYIGGYEPPKPLEERPLFIEEHPITEGTYIMVNISLTKFPFSPRYQIIAGFIPAVDWTDKASIFFDSELWRKLPRASEIDTSQLGKRAEWPFSFRATTSSNSPRIL